MKTKICKILKLYKIRKNIIVKKLELKQSLLYLPIELIKEEMSIREIPLHKLTDRLCMDTSESNDFIAGKMRINLIIASELERILGINSLY